MHKILVLYPPPPDPAKFRDYYENTHIPLAQKLPGMRSYSYAFDAAPPGGGESPYFCVFEAVFDDAAAAGAAMGSPEGQAVAADVANYAAEAPPTIISFDIAGSG